MTRQSSLNPPPSSPSAKRTSSLWKRIGRIILLTVGLCLFLIACGGVLAAGTGIGWVASLVKDQPILPKDEMVTSITENHQTAFIYFRDGQLIGQLRSDEDRENVSLEEVPDDLIHAFIATEDRTFYENPGIDLKGLLRAVLEQVTQSETQTGGSTITQQLIKNAVLEDPSQTYSRKAREIFLALRLSRIMSKEEILTAYLNEIYFGVSANNTQVYGVQSAAKGIFNADVHDLTLAQAAYLAGIPQNPAAYSPFSPEGIERGKARQQTVLNRMLEEGYITEQEYNEALAFDIARSLAEHMPRAYEKYPFLTVEVEERAAKVLLKERGMTEKDSGYDEALSEARQEILRSGYHITTTIDKKLYDAMQEIAQNPDNFPENKTYTATIADGKTIEIHNAPLELGSVLIHNRTGAILGMIAGRDFWGDFEGSQVNHATDPSRARQPGSAIKPLVDYAPAIEMGLLQPATAIDDSPVMYQVGEVNYVPGNYDGRFDGLNTARVHLNKSRNIPAIKVFHDLVGIPTGLDYAEKNGMTTIHEKDYNAISVGIGGMTLGVTPEEMANAYATFANGGTFIDAYLIEKIEGPNGELIYQHKVKKEPVYSEETAFLITDMLRTVLTEGTAARIWANLDEKRPLAGKTGTSQNWQDLWFVGYTPEITLSLWTGYNIPYSQKNEDNIPKDLWVKIFNHLMETDPALSPPEADFAKPSGVVKQTVCSLSGKLPTELCKAAGTLTTDWFNEEHLPREACDVHVKQNIVVYNGRNYLAKETTPEDMLVRGVFVKREPYYVPPGASSAQYRPRDWQHVLPAETDPREDDGPPPTAPQSLSITGEGSITLHWKANIEADVVGYRIYRADDGSSQFTKIGVVLASESPQFTDLEEGAFSYRITAVDVAGKESAPSDVVGSLSNPQEQNPGGEATEVLPSPDEEQPAPAAPPQVSF